MALSNSTDYILTAQQIIEDALSKVGGFVEGESLSTTIITRTRRTLNTMLKALQNKGLNIHTRKIISITPVASQRIYTMGPSGADVTVARPLKIIQVDLKLTSDSSFTTLIKLMHRDYYELNDREVTTGNPTQWFYDQTLTNGTLYLSPIPDADTVSNYTLEAIYRKPWDDIDANTDNLEVPPNWYEAIILQLAKREAHHYPITGHPLNALRKDARDALMEVEGQEIEDELQFQPEIE